MTKLLHVSIRVLARLLTLSEILIKSGFSIFAFFLLIRIGYGIMELALSFLNIPVDKDVAMILLSLLCLPTSYIMFNFIRSYNIVHLNWASHYYRRICRKPNNRGKVNAFFGYLTLLFLFCYFIYLGCYLVTDSLFMRWKISVLMISTYDLGKLIGTSDVASFMYFIYFVVVLCLLSCLTIKRSVAHIWKSAELPYHNLCGYIAGILYTLGIAVAFFPFLFVLGGHEMQWQYECFFNDVILRDPFGTSIQYRYMHRFLLPSLSIILLNIILLITDIRQKRFSFLS